MEEWRNNLQRLEATAARVESPQVHKLICCSAQKFHSLSDFSLRDFNVCLQFHTQMHVYLLANKSAKHGEKGTPSHAKICDCVSALGILPKGGGVKRFGWGRGPQVLSLKPGGGVVGKKKSGRGKWMH